MGSSGADWGAIQVRGARENNLRDINLDIPKRRLTVFTGVSGSGKSSLVFETIAAESRRLINETYTAFLQGFMGTPSRPDVDSLENLSAAIVVDQERMGANARSTVGTVTDAYDMLRVIFSRLGQPHIGSSSAFSFNVPAGTISGEITLERGKPKTEAREITITGGMCPECEGLGRVSSVDIDALVDRDKSLNEGAITFPGFQPGTWYHRIFVDSKFFDPDKPLRDFTDAEWERFLYGPEAKVKTELVNLTYEGLVDKIRSRYLIKDADSLQPSLRAAVERVATFTDCPSCEGTRLNEARAIVADRRQEHRRVLGDADQRPGRVAARPRRARCGADDRASRCGARHVRLHRPRLPEPGSRVVDPVGRRVAARQDGPPPRLEPDRHDLRLRRADDRPPCARRGADERPPPAAA